MADTPEVIATLAREAQLQQLATIDGLDTKAASMIGFAGVVLGLLFTAPASTDRWNVLMSAGAASIVASVIPLALALLPRRYAFSPNIRALAEGLGDAAPQQVHEVTTKSIVRALPANAASLRFKSLLVRVATGLLVAGLLLATTGVLYALNQQSIP